MRNTGDGWIGAVTASPYSPRPRTGPRSTAAGTGPRDAEGPARAGCLMAPDEGTRTHTTKELVAEDEGIDGGAASAEEAAAHVVSEEQLPSPSWAAPMPPGTEPPRPSRTGPPSRYSASSGALLGCPESMD